MPTRRALDTNSGSVPAPTRADKASTDRRWRGTRRILGTIGLALAIAVPPFAAFRTPAAEARTSPAKSPTNPPVQTQAQAPIAAGACGGIYVIVGDDNQISNSGNSGNESGNSDTDTGDAPDGGIYDEDNQECREETDGI